MRSHRDCNVTGEHYERALRSSQMVRSVRAARARTSLSEVM